MNTMLRTMQKVGYRHPWLVGTLVQSCVSASKSRDLGLAGDYAVIPTHMFVDEKLALHWLARHLRPNAIIVEIGSYLGASATYLAAGLRAGRGGRVVCVDTWQNDAMQEDARDTLTEFLSNTQVYHDMIVPLRGRSDIVAGNYSYGPIDLLFIDGDHSYEGCHTDWESWHPYLGQSSLVVFHDYTRADGVRRVADIEVPLHFKVGLNSGWSSLRVFSLESRVKCGD